jgi:hypothetical protein
MSEQTRFLARVPFVLAGVFALAVGLIYASALPDVQWQLALAIVD